MPERFRVGPEDYVSGRVLRIDTIRSSGPASLKVTWILASSFPVSSNEAGPEDLIVSIRNNYIVYLITFNYI
jgi:hypothetical protein